MDIHYFDTAFYVAGVISATFLIQHLVCRILNLFYTKIAKKTKTKFDDELISILTKTLGIGIWIAGIIIVLSHFEVDIKSITATLGVGSLAVALAAKDTIANILAGFMVMIDKPFRIGDRIKLSSNEVVTVLDIGVRRSKFLLMEDEMDDKTWTILIVPNVDLSKNKIHNFTYAQEYIDNQKD